ncbi:MAG: helix-hairpin-helix domain-containing protein [Flavobacteriales bacterium]|nr:helix-hairpin-helix domain-containing protein [Flavobacteriales bacterium]
MGIREFYDSVTFSKRERFGIVSLVIIFFIVLLIKWLQVYQAPKFDQFESALKASADSAMQLALSKVDTNTTKLDSAKSKSTEVEESFSVTKKKPKTKKIETFNIELNGATQEDLERLRGIGPTYAKRIIKFRNLLGGFVRKSQLQEVYGIDSANFHENLKNNVTINKSIVSKININTDSLKHLARHPYISWDLAKQILNYRKRNGDIVAIEELRLDLLNEDIYTKIAPYLKLDDN